MGIVEVIRNYQREIGWTIQAAIDTRVPAPVIASLFKRCHSRQQESYPAQILAALRNEFGGHEVKSYIIIEFRTGLLARHHR